MTKEEELTENSLATYRYLEMLENILDLEESDQVLYKLQVLVALSQVCLVKFASINLDHSKVHNSNSAAM